MSDSRTVHLSIVIPAYNEERRIAGTLGELQEYLARQNYRSEILVVDDGSDDQTAKIVRASFPDMTLISYPINRGKGHAVKVGMLAARGAYRLSYDADASTPVSELEKVWPEFERGAAVVIGSRALRDSQIEVRQPMYREYMGRTYNLLLRALLLTRFRDTQCGFKCFTAKCTQAVFPHVTRMGYGSDCEILYIAKLHGFQVVQVPVRWIDSPDTRVRVIRDSLDMIREVLHIRFNTLTGKYR
ncbi:MAG: glycosyltransferase family 2 protein [Candidatus Hydrogenedentes bacterium]|nr:glycosyltransferase family 2 protein [Candidatus Hydrogenedentota bacterium]